MSTVHRIKTALETPSLNGRQVLAALVVAAALVNIPSLLKTLSFASQPRGLTYTEGVNAILATRPEIWFQPVAQAPHFPTIYPLGYHALVNVLWRLTSLSPFLLMHAIGLAAALVGAAAVAALIRSQSNGWVGPAVGGSLYLLSPAVSGASVLGRVDHLGVALGLLALLAARKRRLWPAVGLTVAAMYVKHSLAVFPLAIFVWWLVFERKREAIIYAASVATIGLAILGTLTWLTDGQAWMHLITYNRLHPWMFSVFSGQVVWFAYTHIGLVAILGYCLLSNRISPFAGTFGIAALIMAFITIGKVGSWVGYFLPVIASTAIIAGELIERERLGRWIPVALATLLMLQFVIYGAWAVDMEPKYGSDAQRQAIEDVQRTGGPILAEDGTLYVKTGVGQVHEPLMMRFVYEYPNYNGGTLANDIRNQRFKRIIIGQPIEDWQPGDTTRWHDDELVAIQEHYVRAWHAGFYYVYVPKQR